MKIRINNIEDGRVKFALVNEEGAESNELSASPVFFEDVKTMISFNLNFDEVNNSELIGVLSKYRLKSVNAQIVGFALPA